MIKKLILSFCLLGIFFCASAYAEAEKPLLVRVFHSPTCKACHKVIHDVIPAIAQKYGSRVEWKYLDIADQAEYEKFLELEEKTGRELGTPTILIGRRVLVGVTQAADGLDKAIQYELVARSAPVVLKGRGVDLLERFRSFGPLAIITAGLVDGINPCAFTVIVFFVSFLNFMGYRRREMALIGSAYVVAVFLTYLALGLGLFNALYSLRGFLAVTKVIYWVIGGLSLFLGCLAMNDYFLYKKTGRTDDMALQLPAALKSKIHSIVGEHYRKERTVPAGALWGLFTSALAVGFMVSLLEAVCTGQLYLPTIIFVLKEGSLRARALFYLVLYNGMFIAPLVLVLLLALLGASSKDFESFTRRHFALIKIAMAAVFFALGVVLWVGVV